MGPGVGVTRDSAVGVTSTNPPLSIQGAEKPIRRQPRPRGSIIYGRYGAPRLDKRGLPTLARE